jgi:hypothetical protein
MRELESSLQQFGEFLLKAQVVRPTAAPYFVRWVRRFLSRPASDEPLADWGRLSFSSADRGHFRPVSGMDLQEFAISCDVAGRAGPTTFHHFAKVQRRGQR